MIGLLNSGRVVNSRDYGLIATFCSVRYHAARHGRKQTFRLIQNQETSNARPGLSEVVSFLQQTVS